MDTIAPRLLDCDHIRTINEYKSFAIDAGKDAVIEYIEKEYKNNLSLDDAIKLGLSVLK